MKGLHLADRFGIVISKHVLAVFLDHPGNGQKWLQIFFHAYRTGAGPSAAVGCGKGLVEVQVHYVNPDVAHFYHPHDRIHICTVTIYQATFGVDDFGYFPDIFLKKAQGIGIGYHDSGRVFIHDIMDCLHGEDSLFIGFHRYRMVTAEGDTCRVCTMCRIRYNDAGPLNSPAFVVPVDKEHSCKLAVGTRRRLKGSRIKAGYFGEILLQFVHHLERSL